MVDLQSTNRTKLSKVRETTFGTPPTTPAFKEVRNTSSSLNANPQNVISNEIRLDRQLTDVILVGTQAGGDVNGELSFSAFDDDFEEVVQGTWSTTPNRDNNGTADSVITNVATTGTIVTCLTGAAFVASQLVLFSGFGVANNNGVFKCTTGSATVPAFVGSGITDEAVPPANAKIRVVGFRGASGDLVAVTSGGNGITSTSLDFTTLGLAVGMLVHPSTFALTPADNGWCRISIIAAHKITFDIVPTGWAADAGTATVVDVYFGDVLTNNYTKRSNTIERQYQEHSPASYEYFTGMTLNSMSLSFAEQAIVAVTRSYMGSVASITTTRVSGATDVAAPTYDVMNTSSDVGELEMDGAVITGPNFVISATLTINNNLRMQNAIGHLGAVGIGNGEFNVSLSAFKSYFGSKAIYDKVLASTPFGLTFEVNSEGTNNEAYMIDLPRLKFLSGAPAVSGKNSDVVLDGTAQALRDPTLGYTISIQRFFYLPAVG